MQRMCLTICGLAVDAALFQAAVMTDIGPHLLDAFRCSDTKQKAAKSRDLFSDIQAGSYTHVAPCTFPDRPGRPEAPALLAPRFVPRRRITAGKTDRIALLHAIAHIELNAIDLALDMAGRYAAYGLPFDFVRDWLSVANDEAKHFMLLSDRLESLGSFYGDLPAHDGLWEAALATRDDLAGRLAIAPLVLEARGLDVTPQLISKVTAVGDQQSADILQIIMEDEVGHVATGKKWFDFVCGCERRDPISSWQGLVRQYFRGDLKPPFNLEARTAAKFSAAFYGPLAAGRPSLEPADNVPD